MAAGPRPRHVFINVPFDPSYEPLFVTLIGSLVFLGQKPHSVLEVREQGDGRLKRMLDLMRRCQLSMHDLSRVGVPVRFNMPFELGLACALQLTTRHRYEVFVLDAKERRLDLTLSDYKGRDPLIHNGTCDGMIACLMDAFETGVPDATRRFRRGVLSLRQSAEVMKRELKTNTLFRPLMFRRLVMGATEIARKQRFVEA
jgi:hypothetical protein